MLKFLNTDIVMREVPNEVSLAFNITNCTHKCRGCHTPELRKDIGTELNNTILINHIKRNEAGISCVLFLGGKYDEVIKLIKSVRFPELKWAWYTGDNTFNKTDLILDYVKIGEYIEELGPINKVGTNQKMYKRFDYEYKDITYMMQ